MSWQALSQFMWGVSDLCFKTYDRLQHMEAQQSPLPQHGVASRLPSLFKMVQMGAESLGLQAVQSENDPRFCYIIVPCQGRTYCLAVIQVSPTDLELRVPSKVPMSKCPRGTAEWLRRRSNDLPWGGWTEGDELFMVAASIKVDTFLENVENAATLMVGEAAAFDTALINKGYA